MISIISVDCFSFAHSSASLTLSLAVLSQILIELETALLDDIPHWYKLQTHDVSSIPLPQPSPYLPRRHVHGDSPSKKLQSMSGYICYLYRLYASKTSVYKYVCLRMTNPCFEPTVCVSVCLLTSPLLSFSFVSLSVRLTTEPLNLTLSCVCVCVVYVYSGSHRITDTEFDDGLMVVTKGGWGAWLLSISLY